MNSYFQQENTLLNPFPIFSIPENLNLASIDPITKKSYKKLIDAKNGLPYVLALTQDPDGMNTFTFDSLNLRRWIQINPETPMNPLTLQKLGTIFFFIITQTEQPKHSSRYLGNSEETGDRKLFIDLFLKASDNDAKSMYDLSKYHETRSDRKEAMKWLKSAAEAGFSQAQFELGYHYDLGLEIDKNAEIACQWFKLSAEQGHPEAQYYYAFCFYNGEVVVADFDEAHKWWQLSADLGDLDALEALYVCTKKDFDETHNQRAMLDNVISFNNKDDDSLNFSPDLDVKDLLLSAKKGDPDAQYELGCHFYSYDLRKGFHEIFFWMRLSANQGNLKAQHFLSSFEFREYWLKEIKNESDRLDNFEADAEAQFQLGNYYQDHYQEWDKDIKVFNCWLLSAEQGHPTSQYNLGIYYLDGIGVDKDLEKSFDWFLLAAAQGDVDAQFNVAKLYETQVKNYPEAAKWYLRAAKQGDPLAQYNIGSYYYEGKGLKKDLSEAINWWKLAAEQGDIDAVHNLNLLSKQ